MVWNTSIDLKRAGPVPGESDPTSTEPCYHCGLAVPIDGHYVVQVLGEERRVCCPGCQAVAQAIVDGGFERFYSKRTNKSQNPEIQSALDLEMFDIPEVQSKYIRSIDDRHDEVTLSIEGINCGACMWLIETCVGDLPGVQTISVNYSTRRVLVSWRKDEVRLQDILNTLRSIGFNAHPYAYQERASRTQQQRDRQIRRMGISGVLGMQIMMIAVALYFGKSSGIGQNYEVFFKWVSMLLAIPIVLYCAQPFFKGAWRSIVHRQPSIDVPVSLAVGLAFIASIWATLSGRGDTYFEAVAMFVFLLLSVRYFEFTARERGLDAVAHLHSSLPALSHRIDADGLTKVAATQLKPNDRVWVGAGETIPADSILLSEACAVDESIISGESAPVAKELNDRLIGGSVNLGDPITIGVIRTYDHSVISSIIRLADRAQSVKPRFAQLVDRIAAWFVIGLILIASAVALYYWWYYPERLLPTVIAVLVIACPCALSLATPAALSASVGTLTRRGIVLLAADGLEKLTHVTHIAFDKTGTLTTGKLKLESIRTVDNRVDAEEALLLATALDTSSKHPVARALASASESQRGDIPSVTELTHIAGSGVSGSVAHTHYYFGSEQFIDKQTGLKLPASGADWDARHNTMTNCVLASHTGILAVFYFSDELRPEAGDVVNSTVHDGLTVSILSGDCSPVVESVAATLNVSDYQAALSPEQKLETLRRRQADGEIVLAVGDGINDAPLLSAAAMGVAMGSGVDLTQITADAVLVNNRLTDLNLMIRQAQKTRRIIRQNFTWALGYNLLALPLGILGFVPPWIAVSGMSLSSLIVVLNALRLAPFQRDRHAVLDQPDASLAYA